MSQQEITVVISNSEISNSLISALVFIREKLKQAGIPEPFWDRNRGLVAANGRLRYERNPGSGTSTYVWQSADYVKEHKDETKKT